MIVVGSKDLEYIRHVLDSLNAMDGAPEGIGLYLDIYQIPLVCGDVDDPESISLIGYAEWEDGTWVFKSSTEQQDTDYCQMKVNQKAMREAHEKLALEEAVQQLELKSE